MKVYHASKVISMFLLLFFIVFSCSSDDSPSIGLASVSFTETNLTARFSETGSSAAPTVDWNGNQGTFALATEIEGLSINSTTGEISWSRLLKPITQEFQVVVSNSAGQTIVNMTINNTLEGVFTGIYTIANNATEYFFELAFFTDGTVEVRGTDAANPSIGTGTWQLTNNDILLNYSFPDFLQSDYSTFGTLSQTSTNAVYAGTWYIYHEAMSGNEGGEFEVILN